MVTCPHVDISDLIFERGTTPFVLVLVGKSAWADGTRVPYFPYFVLDTKGNNTQAQELVLAHPERKC